MGEPSYVTVCAYTEEGPGRRLYGRTGGVYSYRVEEGRLVPADQAEMDGAQFQAVHPDGTVLYTAHRIEGGLVVAHRLDRATGELTELNRVPSEGARPSYVSTDGAGRVVLVANGHPGTVAVLPVGNDGALAPASDVVHHEGSSVHPRLQARPNPHAAVAGPDDRFVYVPDRGIDQVVVYHLDAATGELRPADPPFVAFPGGTGPRHLVVHPDEEYVYVVNELAPSVTGFALDADTGRLDELGTWSTLPADADPGHSHGADIHVHPSGRWLYASNRGHDTLARFAVDERTGELTPEGHEPSGGHWPRSFAIAPDGDSLFVANRRSDAVVTFAVDPDTGELRARDGRATVPEPVCVDVVG